MSMKIPLVQEEEIKENPYGNLFIKNFADIFEKISSCDIFPSLRDKKIFQKKDSTLYVYDRPWLLDDVITFSPKGEEKYEEYFDYLFWKVEFHSIISFVIGSVGCGKSTFIDYYLRSYCPFGNQYPNKKSDYEHKIVIKVDAKGIRGNEDFNIDFYRKARNAIKESCIRNEIQIDRIIEEKFRTDIGFLHDHEWVDRALSSISDKNSENPVYVVIFIDNLDQASSSVQKRAMRIVENWTEEYTIWKAYIPLWPHTLERLRYELGRLPPHETVDLPPPNPEKLMESRIKCVKEEIAKEITKIHKESLFKNRGERDIINWFFDFLLKTLKNGGSEISDGLCVFLSKITNNNFRISLLILRDFAYNAPFFEYYKSLGINPSKYNVYSAIINGRYSYYNKRKSLIVNIFDATRDDNYQVYDHKRVVIGYHILCLLRESSSSKKLIFETLISWGYTDAIIMKSLDTLLYYNFFHEETSSRGHVDKEIVIHSDVIATYFALIFEPSYIDAMSLVTPIDMDRCKRMIPTSYTHNNQFRFRVETSIEFMEQIKEDELMVEQYINRDKYYHLPFAYKEAANRYKDRLQSLKNNYDYPGASDLWWAKMLDRIDDIINI